MSVTSLGVASLLARSHLAVRIDSPLVEYSMVDMSLRWAGAVDLMALARRSQILTLPSSPPVAREKPSGEKSQARTLPEWPWKCCDERRAKWVPKEGLETESESAAAAGRPFSPVSSSPCAGPI